MADRAIAFLEDLLPRQAWVLAALGSRKIEVATFVLQTYGQAERWITERLKAKRAIKLLTATSSRYLTIVPAKSDLAGTRHVGVEIAPHQRTALVRPKPAVVIKTVRGFIALWRFPGVVPLDVAERAEAAIMKHLGGKALNHFIPLPGLGGVELIDLHKDRIALPTDFTASAAPKAEAVAPRAVFKSADSVELEAIRWLWPQVVPLGALTLLAGAPGMGKSQIACAIAGTLTSGGTWPDGTRSTRVYLPGQTLKACEPSEGKRGVFGVIKRELRRRSAIEAMIGQEDRRPSPTAVTSRA